MKIYEDQLTKVHKATVCDITHTDACASLKLNFGYGSRHDGIELHMDLNDETSEEILQLLISKYGAEKINSLKRDYFE